MRLRKTGLQPQSNGAGMRTVDLNCDFGESYGAYTFGQDEALLKHVTSVSIACGFHAGDPHTMREAVERAMAAGVSIGAHPGLPDRLGFGRREMAISAEEACDYTLYQVGALQAFVRAAGGKLRHVKPHGALYHMAGHDEAIAAAVVRAVKSLDPALFIYSQSGSLLLEEARRQGMRAIAEVFADRTYLPSGALTPRHLPKAVLTEPEEALGQALDMIIRGKARTAEGSEAAVLAETVCLHGDGPNALHLAASLRQGLQEAGIRLQHPQ
ncbi:5-oxoprolinase subunit A [Paenibacillus plantiphilus]|uniref:5-oxoprolinase subunit A n=2 Tax=Paenibacillus plantiphilus TaxID=2905650 RepID=A0ABM9CG17_9BACL|nr:5-oxoprolinase subunit PxpA [Paenibacillus plantiphilus]CAH1211768.1 5-oxoprolinase subunit A [Paenibacillus plantiphilus]